MNPKTHKAPADETSSAGVTTWVLLVAFAKGTVPAR